MKLYLLFGLALFFCLFEFLDPTKKKGTTFFKIYECYDDLSAVSALILSIQILNANSHAIHTLQDRHDVLAHNAGYMD